MTSLPLRKKNKLKQFFFTASTLAATAAINYTIIHSPFVLVLIMTLFVHELGHYIIAKYKGANPDLPYFIPLFPLIIGVTRIKDLKDEHKSAVAIAGASFASLFLLSLIGLNYFLQILSMFPLFVMLVLEIFFNTIGSDGKKYRKYKLHTV